MKVPLERMCYSCKIMVHRECEGSVHYQGVIAACMCQENNHETDLDPLYEPLHPIPERVAERDHTVGWQNVLAAYGILVGRLDRLNRMVEPGERAHVPFAIQEVLADYIEERKAIESIEDSHVTRDDA